MILVGTITNKQWLIVIIHEIQIELNTNFGNNTLLDKLVYLC